MIRGPLRSKAAVLLLAVTLVGGCFFANTL
jgi:hypothetical protein